MKILHNINFALSSLTVIGMLCLTGCGGGNKSVSPTTAITQDSGRGQLEVSVAWPATRAIPSGTTSILVEVRNGDVVRKQTILRPASSVVFKDLYAGSTMIRAFAYAGSDGSGELLASGENQTVIVSDAERGTTADSNKASVVMTEVPPSIAENEFVLGGTAAIDPSVPDRIRITLNAIVNRADGKPLEGLIADNFFVSEDGIERKPLEVSPVEGTSSRADVAFIVDTTSSMGDEIAGVRDSIIGFVNDLEATGIDVRLAGVDFGDEVRTRFPFTSNAEDFRSWVDGLNATGGDDLPENPLDATVASLAFNWRPDAQHVIVVITDATAHQLGDGSNVASETFDSVVNKTIGNYVIHTVSPAGTRSRSLADNQQIASAAQQKRAAGISGSGRAATTDDQDVRILADRTGGTNVVLASNGNVDLTQLPVKDAILKGYLIRFKAPRSNRDHVVRVVVKYEDRYVSDQLFNTRY